MFRFMGFYWPLWKIMCSDRVEMCLFGLDFDVEGLFLLGFMV